MKTWLLLDTNYLCWRAFHSTGSLSHEDVPTGVLFGVLRDILILQEEHGTNNVAFCFDFGKGARRNLLPTYKSSREKRVSELTKTERKARKEMQRQVDLLRTFYLKRLGFRNVLFAEGFEADDIIASVCCDLSDHEQAIIISADQDLYQLLREDQVRVWNPQTKKWMTEAILQNKFYGIQPEQWANVKALAGCHSDDVPGIDGVGEKTAAKFFAGLLPQGSKTHIKIKENLEDYRRNLRLTRLPFKGTPSFTLQSDNVTEDKWQRVLAELGINALWDRHFPHQRKGIKKRKGFGLP